MSGLDTFRALVLSNSTVSAQVGTKMYPSLLPPEAQTPAITYFVVSDVPDNDTCDDYYTTRRIQTNVYAPTLSVVQTIQAAMATMLHRYNGTYNGQDIVKIVGDFGMTTYEPETGLHRWVSDWKVTTKGF